MVIDDNGLQYVDIEELVHDQGDKPSEEKLDNNKTSSTSSSRVLENKVHDILTKSGKKTEDESDVNSVVINLRVLDGNRHQQDEFYVFGEHIANELRHLKDPKYALVLAEVKQKINTILNEAEMHRLRLDSQQIPRPSTSIQMTYAIQIPVPSSHSNTVVTAVQTNDE
ncbi:hypothetical protein C0J52_20853 [Blattella germanica]|nr:hypothetical protein C0J52_20853 [Blattella germanica]